LPCFQAIDLISNKTKQKLDRDIERSKQRTQVLPVADSSNHESKEETSEDLEHQSLIDDFQVGKITTASIVLRMAEKESEVDYSADFVIPSEHKSVSDSLKSAITSIHEDHSFPHTESVSTEIEQQLSVGTDAQSQPTRAVTTETDSIRSTGEQEEAETSTSGEKDESEEEGIVSENV
jgi:hypothetical protein